MTACLAFSGNHFQLLNPHRLAIGITAEGSLPEMRIWSILLINSYLKWCINLSRSLFLYDIIKMLEFLVNNTSIFVVFAGKVFQQTVGIPLCPSSRRHLSVFIRSRIYTVFALSGKKTVSISVQSHLQVHR